MLGRPLIIVGQGPTALAVSAGGAIWTFFSLSSVIPYGTFRQYFSLLESFSDHPNVKDKQTADKRARWGVQ